MNNPQNKALAVKKVLSVGCVILALGFSPSLVMAESKSPLPPQPTKSQLEKDGYKCERGGINDFECKKKGSPTYTCDGTGKACDVLKTGPKHSRPWMYVTQNAPNAYLSQK